MQPNTRQIMAQIINWSMLFAGVALIALCAIQVVHITWDWPLQQIMDTTVVALICTLLAYTFVSTVWMLAESAARKQLKEDDNAQS